MTCRNDKSEVGPRRKHNSILPSSYDEQNNLSARREPAFVRNSLDSMTSSGIINHVLVKPTCLNPLTVASHELDSGSRKLRLYWDGSRWINPAFGQIDTLSQSR